MLPKPQPTIVLDTNVLLGHVNRGLFLLLAKEKLCFPHWSLKILSELNRCPLPEQQLKEALKEMEQYPSGMMRNVPASLTKLPDPTDEHVLALAQSLKAHFILTHNKRDFPQALCGDIAMLTPDEFFSAWLEQNPNELTAILRQHAGSENWAQYLEKLNRARLHQLSRALEELLLD